MSFLVLDEHLKREEVFDALSKHYSVRWLSEFRPRERVGDDRIPAILLTLDRPTLITTDVDFWDRNWCHSGYCVLYFDLETKRQRELPTMLRALFRLPEFRTRKARMGKVAHIRPTRIDFWQAGDQELKTTFWKN